MSDSKAPIVAPYRYVAIVGIDGMGAFCRDAKSPNIRRIFKNGATAYDCRSVYPSGSAECWGTMLTGIMPEIHKFTNDSLKTDQNSGEVKTVFRLLMEQKPNTHAASFCCWSLLNPGIVEDLSGVTREKVEDCNVGKRVAEYIEEKGVPELLFIQMNSPDAFGHQFGYGTKEHLEVIDKCDGYAGEIYEAYERAGVIDETLFIVTSDHGGTCFTIEDGTVKGTHGGDSEREMKVFFGAVGKGVKNTVLKDARIQDVAAIACYALGIKGNEGEWKSKIPTDLFENV